jgi:peroxiredoxin/transglutaminase-like putative cysteine protease
MNSILHQIAAGQSDESIYDTVCAGADLRAHDADGLTAHEVAMANGNAKAVAQLAEAELWLAPQNPAFLAPDFSVNDLDGNQVTLSSFRGRVVALFFFRPLSDPKNFHYTWLDYAQKLNDSSAAKEGKLAVLVVAPDASDATRNVLQEHGYTFRVLSDPQDTVRTALGLYAMPAILIDAQGRLVWQLRLGPSRAKVEDGGLFLAVKQVLADNLSFRPVSSTAAESDDDGQVIFDFEDGFDGWKMAGDCWGKAPATDALYPGLVKGYAGHSFLSSFGPNGTKATGVACSPDFVVTKPFLHFLIGGSDLPDHCAVTLVNDGLTVRRTTGRNTAELEPACWDMRDLMGKTVHMEAYDSGTDEPRDFIMLDQVVASDTYVDPPSYAKRFDPNDPENSAEVADSMPGSYKTLQAGNFHETAVPGPTYRLERTNTVRWPDGPADWLQFSYVPSPTHFAQTIRSFHMTITADGKSYEAKPVTTGRAFMPETYVCLLPASDVPDRQGVLRVTCEVTPNHLRIRKGKSESQRPSADLHNTLVSSYHYDYADPAVAQFITRNELWRWSGETDAHYLLRAYRYFQRYFTYVGNNGIPWGGWHADPGPLQTFKQLDADCGLARQMVLLLRANGIPAHYEQGFWVGDNGIAVYPHVKALVYLQEVGWLWFGVHPEVNSQCDPFDLGSLQGNDNFVGEWLDDLPAVYPIPKPQDSKVLNGRISGGGDWWHSWVDTPAPAPNWFVVLDGTNGFYASPGVPDHAVTVLEQAQKDDKAIKSFSFTPDGDWVLLSNSGFEASSDDLPGYPHYSGSMKDVAFSPDGPWIILYRNGFWGPGSHAWVKVKQLMDNKHKVRSVSYGPGNSFVVLYDETGVIYGGIPNDLAKVLDHAVSDHIPIQCVAFSGRDWICLADDDWWASDAGLPSAQVIAQDFKTGLHPKWVAFVPAK